MSAADGGGESCLGCGSSGGGGEEKRLEVAISAGSSNGLEHSRGDGEGRERARAAGGGGGCDGSGVGVGCCWAETELVVASLGCEDEDEVRESRGGLAGGGGECGG